MHVYTFEIIKMTNECRAVGGMRIGRGNKVHGEYLLQFDFVLRSKPDLRGGKPVFMLLFM
jgi:hypothetical protein